MSLLSIFFDSSAIFHCPVCAGSVSLASARKTGQSTLILPMCEPRYILSQAPIGQSTLGLRGWDERSYIFKTTRPVIFAARISSKTSLICSSVRVST